MILRKRRRNEPATNIDASPSESKTTRGQENDHVHSRRPIGFIQKHLFPRVRIYSSFITSPLLLLSLISIVILVLEITTLFPKRNTIDLLKDQPPTFENSTYFESNNNYAASGSSTRTAAARLRAESSTLHSLRYQCTQRDHHNRNSSSFPSEKALAKIVLFQSNGGHQLKNFMAYYAQVIPLCDIVIIDHTKPQPISKKQQQTEAPDPYTQSLLEQYHDLGADIWHCNGDFEHKNEIWSWVTHRYASNSEFVFPLDIDEYIAILKDDIGKSKGKSKGKGKQIGEQKLTWNHEDLEHALEKLGYTGKPFKMELGNIYPIDCHQWYSDAITSLSLLQGKTNGKQRFEAEDPSIHSDPASSLRFEEGPMQNIKFVARRGTKKVHCMDKVFMRGNEFNFTDTGNHYGQTHSLTKEQSRQKCVETNETTYQLDQDQKTDLFLMHFQFTDFQEWLMHSLRGASDRGFNRFSWLKKCRQKMTSREYCLGWKALLRTKFDPREMKLLYEREACSAFEKRAYLRYDVHHLLNINGQGYK